MRVCAQKPDMLPPLDALGLEPLDQASLGMTRGGSGRHRQGSDAAAPSRQVSVGLGFGPSSGPVSSPPPTPYTASLPNTRLTINTNAFVPPGRAKITIKSGRESLSALATVQNIDDIGTVQYPEGVMSPKPKLNANVKDGRFRYDFLCSSIIFA